MLPINLCEPELCIGSVIEVGPATAKAKLPDVAPAATQHNGHRCERGKVGDFVVVELDDGAIFGRIVNVRLSQQDGDDPPDQRSVATIQLLSTISLPEGTVEAGLLRYPG